MGVFVDRRIATVLIVVISTLTRATTAVQCGKAYLVNDKKSASFRYGVTPDLACKWELFGTRTCEVEVTCTVDLPKDKDCGDNYLLITDGWAGAKKSCGSEVFTLKASKGLRDLFLVLMTADDITGKHKGIECTAKCASSGSTSAHLSKDWSRKTDQRCVCGLRNEDDRIVGGVDARFNEFPWLVAIVNKGTRSPFCGGALINDRFVLTAAHCFVFAQKQPSEIDVLLRAHTLDMTVMAGGRDVALGLEGSIRGPGWDAAKKSDADEGSIRLEAEEIINHPLFTEAYNFDYALIKLKKKVNLADSDLTPVCLPPATTYDSFNLEKKISTVAGWGLADEKAKGSTRVLQKLDVPYIKWPLCKKFFPKYLTDRMICAGFTEGVKDACSGDSGGPLVHQLPNKQFWQVGIVSWGDGCARAKKPGVYSQVSGG
ncbi:unnamed protein product [Orchesella dallaii]|uniref:Uncharacterized protein n=1 Tax=Orchesella dallaii TaxID=48710 RepID=A0ABP1RJ52_9HEXA